MRKSLLLFFGLSIVLGSGAAVASGPYRDACATLESEMVESLRPVKKCLDEVKGNGQPSAEKTTVLCKSQNEAFQAAQVKYHACRKESALGSRDDSTQQK